jgi:hypothetical protein
MRYGSHSLREFPRDFELAQSNSMIDHVSLAVPTTPSSTREIDS